MKWKNTYFWGEIKESIFQNIQGSYKAVKESWGFPGGLAVKNPPAYTGDAVSIPGSGRSPGEGNGNPLQYSCLGNPMDRGAWQATVHGVANESDSTYWFNNRRKVDKLIRENE